MEPTCSTLFSFSSSSRYRTTERSEILSTSRMSKLFNEPRETNNSKIFFLLSRFFASTPIAAAQIPTTGSLVLLKTKSNTTIKTANMRMKIQMFILMLYLSENDLPRSIQRKRDSFWGSAAEFPSRGGQACQLHRRAASKFKTECRQDL